MLAVTTANCFGISLSRFDLLLLGDDFVVDHLLFDCIGESAHFDDSAGRVELDKDRVELVLGLQLPMHANWFDHQCRERGFQGQQDVVHVHFQVFTN